MDSRLRTSDARFKRFPLWLVVAVTPMGCTSLAAPSVGVTAFRVGDRASDDIISLHIDVRVENSNSEPLELQRVSYIVQTAGGNQFQTTRAALVTVPAQGTATLSLPAVLKFNNPISATQDPLPAIDFSQSATHLEEDGVASQAGADLDPQDVDLSALHLQVSGDISYRTPGALEQTLFDLGVRKPSVRFKARAPES